MKKKLSLLAISLFIITVTVFTAFAQQKEKENKGKDKQEKQDKGNKDNKGKDKSDKEDKKDQKDKHDNKDKDKGKDGKDKDDDKHDNGKDNDDKDRMKDGYKWDRETFKDRKKYRDQEKVTICHKINRNDEPPVTLRVSANALKAHLGHGDAEGDCPAVTNNVFSDGFLKRRADYYNTLQNTQEQVYYSRSILDYAMERLANSRSQLLIMQRNNAAQADIDRRQAVVVNLEQNVSVLQTLVGAAANLLVNKLTD
jgi:hypothetical protein